MRYRCCVASLPGKPDIVFRKNRVAVFVNGCFWHAHKDCKRARIPATNRQYWESKFKRNLERDRANDVSLTALGWKVVVVWECEVSRDLVACVDRVAGALDDSLSTVASK
jgi:DNA mismatch endonuclease (patch repair protein)